MILGPLFDNNENFMKDCEFLVLKIFSHFKLES